MPDSPEEWDVLDWRGQPTGRTVARRYDGDDPASGLRSGESHRVAFLCVFRQGDGESELLIQRRAATKIGWPGAWDVTAGGSVLAGESSQDGAMRELREEVGIAVDLSTTRPALTINAPKTVYDVYLVDAPAGLDAATLPLQPDEVDAVAWANRASVLEMIGDGRFVAIKPSLIDFLFALHERPGLQTRSFFTEFDE